jgi:pyrophosphate--fructose-6-phosphate 1-phosphotransferase
MGRAASHITLECALQTQPNICLIGEEVFAEDKSLAEITADMCDVICERATSGRNFGVVLVPEGLIEFIPEMNRLLAALNELLAQGIGQEYIRAKLASFRGTEREPVTEQEAGKLCDLYDFLPQQIRHELLLDRDPHGNVQVSKIETEKLLIELITTELKRRKGLDAYCGNFAAISHFFGYEGRCGLPSNFDATYCYTLGRTAAAVMFADLSGYMAVARYLAKPAQEWEPYAIPLTAMMRTERRAGKWKPVIEKALVDLEGAPFKKLVDNRAKWAAGEFYRSPGPKQFFGDLDKPSHTLTLESELRYPGL